MDALDRLDLFLLDNWQRGLPLEPRPFLAIAAKEGTSEDEVIRRYRSHAAAGRIGRIGAVCRPNTVGASTLAAVAAPGERLEEVAARISAIPGVNHNYEREHALNLWFVVTGRDRAAVEFGLVEVARQTGLAPLDLRLVRAYHIDLGFRLNGSRARPVASRACDVAALEPGDRALIAALTEGLEIAPRPFALMAARLGRDEAGVIARVRALVAAGILPRVGVIVKHREIGYRANAMVVWDLPEAEVDRAGEALARQGEVTLCYRRVTVPGRWRFPLYCMIHGRSRGETLAALGRAAEAAGLADVPREVLFSRRCFKQRGAVLGAVA